MKQDGTFAGLLGATWGFLGAFMLISYAVWRLTPMAMDAFNHSLSMLHWLALVANILFMAYSEGYKGFQQAFSPRVAARSLYLSRNPNALRVLLAPLFVIGYFDATRHRMIISYLLSTMIVILVILTRMVDQPWRGIIDAGVVVGLIWGLASMLYFIVQAFAEDNFSYSPEIPHTSTNT
jgi:hypothetical protein